MCTKKGRLHSAVFGSFLMLSLVVSLGCEIGGAAIPFPAAPKGLAVAGTTASSVSLTWNTVDTATSYTVYYKTASSSTYAISSSPSENSATVSGLIAGTWYDFQVSATNPDGEGKKASITASPTQLLISNDSSYAIDYLYISLSSDSSWGTNVLGESVLAPGARCSTATIAADTYDVKAVDVIDDDIYYATFGYDLPVNQVDTFTLSIDDSGFTGSLRIDNKSASTVTELYLVDPLTDEGDEILDGDSLPNNYSVIVNELPVQNCNIAITIPGVNSGKPYYLMTSGSRSVYTIESHSILTLTLNP